MRRARPSRVRRVGKWAGLPLTALMCAAWLGSGGVNVVLRRYTTRGSRTVQLVRGRIGFIEVRYAADPSWQGAMELRGPTLLPDYWLDWGLVDRFRTGGPGITSVITTVWLWPFVVLFGAPTAWLWWRDAHAAPPGCCPGCGYDVTGIEDGVCPECGETRGSERV